MKKELGPIHDLYKELAKVADAFIEKQKANGVGDKDAMAELFTALTLVVSRTIVSVAPTASKAERIAETFKGEVLIHVHAFLEDFYGAKEGSQQ